MHQRIIPIAALALVGFLAVFSGISYAQEEGTQNTPDVMDSAPATAPNFQPDSDPNQDSSHDQAAEVEPEQAVEPESIPPSDE